MERIVHPPAVDVMPLHQSEEAVHDDADADDREQVLLQLSPAADCRKQYVSGQKTG